MSINFIKRDNFIFQMDKGKYYDTPKRIKEALTDDLFRITNNAPDSLVLKKNCGCILKLASKKKSLVENEDNFKPPDCACQRVTNWASNLIGLPYCRRSSNKDNSEAEVFNQNSDQTAIYATVDVSRKTNRQSNTLTDKDSLINDIVTNYENVKPNDKDPEGAFSNYENLDFAMSLEYYENAKGLLRKAGVTQSELDALSANFETSDVVVSKLCTKCGHSQLHEKQDIPLKNKSDEYLLMEPSSTKDNRTIICNKHGPNPGYTPMSPIPNWSQSLKHPLHKAYNIEIEKSLSIPVLSDSENMMHKHSTNSPQIQKRSSSVDSARLLEDLKEFDSSVGSHATSSSLETLRNMAVENRRSSEECYDQDWCAKSSSSDHKTESSSDSKEMPNLRNKLMDNAQIKRSCSVPCKSGGNRDSSSSNDSGVSSCSLKHGVHEFGDYELPVTSGQRQYSVCRGSRITRVMPFVHSSLPRKSKSSELRGAVQRAGNSGKSTSAEAEVPVLPPKQIRGKYELHFLIIVARLFILNQSIITYTVLQDNLYYWLYIVLL